MARLTVAELEAVLEAAGNVDLCMFDEDPDATEAEKARALAAYDRGMNKLRAMLTARRQIAKRRPPAA